LTVGINPLNAKDVSLALYPNPNNGIFNLAINNYDSGVLTLEIIDVMGKTLFSEEVLVSTKKYQRDLDYGLANGLYFLKISNGNRMRTIRFVVQ
jgi:hypothetical protein